MQSADAGSSRGGGEWAPAQYEIGQDGIPGDTGHFEITRAGIPADGAPAGGVTPKTGDEANPAPWLFMLAGNAAAMRYVLFTKKTKKRG